MIYLLIKRFTYRLLNEVVLHYSEPIFNQIYNIPENESAQLFKHHGIFEK